MTGQERDYEAILSRVLRTTTDQFEPVGDGLTKIRGRLSEPWLKRQWWLLRSEWIALRWLVVVRCESFFSTVKSFFSTVKSGKPGSPAADPAAGPLAPLLACATPATEEHGRRRRSLRPVLGGITAWIASRGPGRGHEDGPRSSRGPVTNWLRPALAVAGAVVIVVGGVFALGNIQQGFGFIGLGADGGSQPGTSSQVGGNGNPYGGGATLKSSSSPSQGRSGTPKPGESAAHNRTPPSPGPCISPTTPPVNNPSPTPTSASPSPTTTSPSPSPTPTPTPTSTSPSPSTSQAPITGGVGTQTQEAIGTTALVMCERPPPSPQPSPSNQAPTGP
jgi:hypothetical protein